jgi:hypothetical protein
VTWWVDGSARHQWLKTDSGMYFTVESDGRQVFDSRNHHPCDMKEWQTIYDRQKRNHRVGSHRGTEAHAGGDGGK